MILALLACFGSKEEPAVDLWVRVRSPGSSPTELEALVQSIEAVVVGQALAVETRIVQGEATLEVRLPAEHAQLAGVLRDRSTDELPIRVLTSVEPVGMGTAVFVDEDLARGWERAFEIHYVVEEMTCVERTDLEDRRTRVTVSPDQLRAHGLSMVEVASSLAVDTAGVARIGEVPLSDLARIEELPPVGVLYDGQPAAAFRVWTEGCEVTEVLSTLDAVEVIPDASTVTVDITRARPRDVAEIVQAAEVLGAAHSLVRWSGDEGPVSIELHGAADPRKVFQGVLQVTDGHPGSDARVDWSGSQWTDVVVTGDRQDLEAAADIVADALEKEVGQIRRGRVVNRPDVRVTLDEDTAGRFGLSASDVAWVYGEHRVGANVVTLGDGDWEAATVHTLTGPVPLTALAEVEVRREPIELVRHDGHPALVISVLAVDADRIAPVMKGLSLPEGVQVR
ncbi:MAG: efflux RND transporter permease subunit [Proteobacteria bacterium]|nr:efflux RND transporter permease subunit [Pseudomonadota bacterium]MCP4916265.1 efflux RND transporter permease subunit [Pseudomonadota bacterium]